MNLFDTKESGIVSSCRAVWTSPLPGEDGAPSARIIHSRWLQLPASVVLNRVGVRLGEGYFKCGGTPERDWISAFRVLVLQEDGNWAEALRVEHANRPADNEPVPYYSLEGRAGREIIVEARRSGVDGWWPSWNVTMDGLILEAEAAERLSETDSATSRPSRLSVTGCELSGLPEGVSAEVTRTEARYRTRHFDVGFSLHRTGFTRLALNESGKGAAVSNLLQFPTLDKWSLLHQTHLAQGIHLHPVGGGELAGYRANETTGSVEIEGNRIRYEIRVPSLAQTYRIGWTIEEDRLVFEAERESDTSVRAWKSSVWSMALDSRVMPTTALGGINRTGEAGSVAFPLFFHAPKFGTLRVGALEGEGSWRFDSVRPIYTNVHEIKLGEAPQPEGDYLLLAGKHRLKLEFKLYRADLPPSETEAPATVVRAVNACLMTGLTYRADTNAFSNNGNSILSPLCIDYWSALTSAVNRLRPEWGAANMLRDTLERWLTDAPGYAAGRSYHHDRFFEDEYLMSGTSALLGLAEYLNEFADATWTADFQTHIRDKLIQMKNRDLDGDGLIESDIRLGISGQHQWSTNWWDVISFGWKDALVNAQLYAALRLLEEVLPRMGLPLLSEGLSDWADRLKRSYAATFFNDETGWFAGWRCKEDKLHDYAFLSVNGTAVTSGLLDDRPSLARSVIEKLWREMDKAGYNDYRLGLPGNLWNVPDKDMAEVMHNRPFGTYENGGATLSQSRHFVSAMYKVGMRSEADELLEGLCAGLADGTAFGGCASGVDWRMWDGSPCGYEGLLCDQFGILIPCVERYF